MGTEWVTGKVREDGERGQGRWGGRGGGEEETGGGQHHKLTHTRDMRLNGHLESTGQLSLTATEHHYRPVRQRVVKLGPSYRHLP